MRFAVNYLAGFLLTRLLLPLLMVGAPARIVNVSSLAQQSIDFDDVMLTHGYTGGRAYAQSKLAQIMFTFDLACELDPTAITVNCLHPATYTVGPPKPATLGHCLAVEDERTLAVAPSSIDGGATGSRLQADHAP